ncbi:hypothetical protein AGLY_008472 [Aphis glycines]|uniref:Uncharacterized protein n=1 Tax=Aphis glycines TaxID=307491 RepID=A0A6G0TK67_APHGL|nr:hypothetical protein AGLY_008472 [Aphis glycines]
MFISTPQFTIPLKNCGSNVYGICQNNENLQKSHKYNDLSSNDFKYLLLFNIYLDISPIKITIQRVYPLDLLEGFEVVPLKPSSKAYGCILFASKLISAGASSFRQKKDSKIELEDLHPMKVTCNPSSLGLSDRLRITQITISHRVKSKRSYECFNFRMICVFFIFASVYLSTAKLVEIKLQFKFVETVFDGKLNIVVNVLENCIQSSII